MKRIALFVALILTSGLALAAFAPDRHLNLYVLNKMLIGNGTEANAITETLSGSIAFDFASVTITCEDSTGITMTGAQAGDPCFVGAPTTVSSAGTGLHSSFTCYVSAADTVKVRHCAAGTADNPASATFYVRVLSSL